MALRRRSWLATTGGNAKGPRSAAGRPLAWQLSEPQLRRPQWLPCTRRVSREAVGLPSSWPLHWKSTPPLAPWVCRPPLKTAGHDWAANAPSHRPISHTSPSSRLRVPPPSIPIAFPSARAAIPAAACPDSCQQRPAVWQCARLFLLRAVFHFQFLPCLGTQAFHRLFQRLGRQLLANGAADLGQGLARQLLLAGNPHQQQLAVGIQGRDPPPRRRRHQAAQGLLEQLQLEAVLAVFQGFARAAPGRRQGFPILALDLGSAEQGDQFSALGLVQTLVAANDLEAFFHTAAEFLDRKSVV